MHQYPTQERKMTERGRRYVIVHFQTQLALLFVLLSGGDNRSANGDISYVLALMDGEPTFSHFLIMDFNNSCSDLLMCFINYHLNNYQGHEGCCTSIYFFNHAHLTYYGLFTPIMCFLFLVSLDLIFLNMFFANHALGHSPMEWDQRQEKRYKMG